MTLKLGLCIVFCCGILLATVTADTNYCNPDICRDPLNPSIVRPHIACNGVTGFASACGSTRQQLPMTEDLKTFILNLHNSARSRAATGKLPNLQSADRMLQVVWDKNLEIIAGFNGRRCLFDHDKCRNTKTYPFSGQNIGMLQSSANYIEDRAAITRMFNLWFDEYQHCTMRAITSYNVPGGPDIGHFTQIVNSKSPTIGCAVMKWLSGGMYKTFFVCNYSLMNIRNQPIYSAGPACSKCSTGCSSTLPGLCNIAENRLVDPVPVGYKGSTSSSPTQTSAPPSPTQTTTTARPTNTWNPWNPWNQWNFGW